MGWAFREEGAAQGEGAGAGQRRAAVSEQRSALARGAGIDGQRVDTRGDQRVREHHKRGDGGPRVTGR